MTASQPESTTTSTTAQQQSSSTSQQSQQPQQSSTNSTSQQQPFNPFANLLGGLGLGQIGQPQATTITFGNMNDLNQGLGGILGSLGIRIPPVNSNVPPQQQSRPATTHSTHNNPFQTPPSNTNRPNQQNNQPTSVFNPTQQQPQTTNSTST